MKSLSLILICSLLGTTLFSQQLADDKSKHYAFFDKYYVKLPDKTGATYVRVFLGVDSVKKTYEVREYTADGQLLFIANSSSKESLVREGHCTWFNNKLKPIKTGYFIKGVPDGILTEYYDNGRMKLQSDVTKGNERINNSWDSTGKAEVIDGNGWYVLRDDTTAAILQTGKVVNGLKDSTWTDFYKNGKKEVEIIYAKGVFVTGTYYDETGKKKTFKEQQTMPSIHGGEIEMRKFLARNVKYPLEDKEMGLSGTVIVQFIVNKDGTISNIGIRSGVSTSINKEAIRVVGLLTDWIPGTLNGKNVSMRLALPIKFGLE